MVNENESISNNFKYVGEQLDKETEQYYLRARFYNPALGRFTQEDIYRGDGLNLYVYVSNNPIMWIDPSGYVKRISNLEFSNNPNVLFPANQGQNSIVNIKMTGEINTDFTQAFNKANISRQEAIGYTWHHASDFNVITGKTTM
jgi:RHS repeat-associated protein